MMEEAEWVKKKRWTFKELNEHSEDECQACEVLRHKMADGSSYEEDTVSTCLWAGLNEDAIELSERRVVADGGG